MNTARLLFRLSLILLFAWSVHVSAQDAAPTNAAPRRSGAYNDALAALRKGETNEAIAILSKMPESDPNFLRTMTTFGLNVLGESLGRPDLGLPLVERAYRKAPHDMEVAYAFIRCELFARTNLSEPLAARKWPTKIPDEFKFIAEAPKFPDTSKKYSKARLLADLDYLEVAIANAYSYADRRGADWRTALDSLRASLGTETPLETFSLRLERFLTIFGDPHSALRARIARPSGFALFIPVADGSRVLALKPDRSGFLDNDCHYLAAMDGVSISNWLRVAGYDVPKASPQWQQRQTVANLIQVGYLRTELGIVESKELKLSLTSSDGKQMKDLTLSITNRPVRVSSWPRGSTRTLDGNIGLLRIRSMAADADFLAELDDSMEKFRDTRGLIIDVRGNGGGSQDALRTLLPYFLAPKAPMKIVNVAAYRLPVRLPQQCTEGYLGLYGRGLHPVTSKAWSAEQHAQIEAFLKSFKSSWQLPEGKFSAWHVMGISAQTNPKAYFYTNPVVVLTDAGCFSATDNFLGSLKGQPNVTLLGTTSGGGSGRMASYVLPNTKLQLTICQMASFRANGDIFDGRGVAPDVVLEPKPEDYITGKGDSVLEAAIERVKK